MDADKKTDHAESIANKKKGPSMTSRALDYEINTSMRDFPEKAENSGLNRSVKEVKQTPDTSMQKSDGYRINFFDLLQNNLFPSSPLNGKVSEKEQSLHQDEEVNIVQGINDFVSLNMLADSISPPERGPARIVANDNQLEHSIIINQNQSRNIQAPDDNNQNQANVLDINNQPEGAEPNNVQIPNAIQQQQNMINNINRGIEQKLRSHLIFYIGMTILYILGCLTFQGYTTFHVPLVYIVAILVVAFIKQFKKEQPASLTLRQKRVKFVTLIEFGIVGFFLFGAALRFSGVEFGLYGFTIPGFLNIGLFLFGTDSLGSSSIFGPKAKTFFKRLYLWIQLLLLSLKGNDEMASWQAAFSLTYYLLFGFLFYSVLVFIIFLSAVLGWRRQEAPYRVNLIGFGWYSLVSVYSWFWFFILMRIIAVLDDYDGHSALNVALIGAIIHSLILIGFVLGFKNQLSQFMRAEINEYGSRRNSLQQNRVERTVKFQVTQEEIPYLVIISPTFYGHIKDTFKLINKNNLLQWIKQIKTEKAKKTFRNGNSIDQERKPNGRFDHSKLFEPIRPSTAIANLNRNDPERVRPFSMIALPRDFESLNMDNEKVFYSLNDMSIYDNIKRPFESRGASMEAEHDKLCYICIERPQNAVFLKCGHGGVCYECALESWKKTDKCLICRQSVEKIVKVDIIDSLRVSKIIHSTRKIVEEKIVNPRVQIV